MDRRQGGNAPLTLSRPHVASWHARGEKASESTVALCASMVSIQVRRQSSGPAPVLVSSHTRMLQSFDPCTWRRHGGHTVSAGRNMRPQSMDGTGGCRTVARNCPSINQ
jgi:hypothetical protein